MLNDQFAKILARKLSGEATPEELNELQDILMKDPECQYLTELLSVYWANSTHFLKSSSASREEDHFTTLLNEAKKLESGKKMIPARAEIDLGKRRMLPFIKRIGLVAAAAGIFVLSYWILNYNDPKSKIIIGENKKNEVNAGRGAKSHLFLPDGSQVWLNSESKLIYNEKFNDSIREVELEGEAFFDVIKDKNHPFIVHASGIDIRVLGTAFNVKSYPREPTIEATLLRGIIEITDKTTPKSAKIILQPHEKIIFDKQDRLLTKNDRPENRNGDSILPRLSNILLTTLPKNIPDTAIKETSWVINKLMFDGETFQELAIKMERWFNTRIYFKNQKVSRYRFRGVFRNENLEQALQALQLTASFTYIINRDNVEISKN